MFTEYTFTLAIILSSPNLRIDIGYLMHYNEAGIFAYDVDGANTMEQAKQRVDTKSIHSDINNIPDSQAQVSPIEDSRFAALTGKYKILEKIGHGAQGNVYKALDSQSNIVAIKCFDLQDAPDWKAVELFKREVDTLRSLSINGIPKYIDFIDSTPYSFLVESYISAKSLKDHIEQGFRPSEQQVLCILRKTLTILRELHHQPSPIIHRDIKPGNILVEVVNDHDVNVWVVDMGTVTSLRQSSHASTIAGTYGYAAPEQLMGNAVPASDIYALGMTIVHLLSGVEPWNMDMNGLNIQYEKYLPSNLSKDLKETLVDMLQPDPNARIPTTDVALALLNSSHIDNKIGNSKPTSIKTSKTLATTLTILPLAIALAGIILFFTAPEFDLASFLGAIFTIIISIVITGAQPIGLVIISILTIAVCFNVSTLMGIGVLLTIFGLFGAFVAFGSFNNEKQG